MSEEGPQEMSTTRADSKAKAFIVNVFECNVNEKGKIEISENSKRPGSNIPGRLSNLLYVNKHQTFMMSASFTSTMWSIFFE